MHSAPLHRIRESLPAAVVNGEAVEAAAFWTAVAVPFAYFPLLHAGLAGWRAYLFVALLLVNAGALVVGHDYNR